MKILIEDITDEGLYLDIEENLNPETYTLASPAKAHVEIQKTGQQVIINGKLNVVLEFQCSRCLREFNNDLDIPFYMTLHPLKEMSKEKHALKDDEMDIAFYQGDEINLKDILEEQILLNIQMKPLCDENCRGLCPKCGKNLNSEECFCENKEIDPRLEVLKSLLEKRKE